MIFDKDRSNWFGASDVKFIVGNYETKTFKRWWLSKLGLIDLNFSNVAMKAGTNYEHKILDAVVPFARKDHQIIIPELKLRINYDGDTENMIYEVKTYNYKDEFKVSKYYDYQVQVQMFAKKIKNGQIISYGLLPNDYKNYFHEIDIDRINYHDIIYNEDFIANTFLPRIEYLSKCLDKTCFPKNIIL